MENFLNVEMVSRPSQACPSAQGSQTNMPIPHIKIEPGIFVKEESPDSETKITVLRDPCPEFGGPHWRKDCRRRRIAGKKRGNKWRSKAMAVARGQESKVYGDREIERSDNDESLYANGHFAIVRIPDSIIETMNEDDFVRYCQDSGIVKPGLQVGPLSKQFWSLRFDNLEEVNSIVGKHVRFTMNLGLEKVVDQKILPYVKNGPKAFYLSNVGPYSDLDIQGMVEKKFKDERFWMGKKMVVGTEDISYGLTLFAAPTFAISVGKGMTAVRYRAHLFSLATLVLIYKPG
ncbi:BgTH12-01119 [Blumeria graminis f. sp. triticale]|uniref:BgtAc-30379 n=3 Tax=Blumeria graminis TaxID=34373 RepID=A0A9X9MN22_BLUGR|nr:BgTH12-01119 [Blumeria graminis f. sp. triticale]VDB93764.1 BgtAc-30379 [Blumeria graminis f. sp. tritici]